MRLGPAINYNYGTRAPGSQHDGASSSGGAARFDPRRMPRTHGAIDRRGNQAGPGPDRRLRLRLAVPVGDVSEPEAAARALTAALLRWYLRLQVPRQLESWLPAGRTEPEVASTRNGKWLGPALSLRLEQVNANFKIDGGRAGHRLIPAAHTRSSVASSVSRAMQRDRRSTLSPCRKGLTLQQAEPILEPSDSSGLFGWR